MIYYFIISSAIILYYYYKVYKKFIRIEYILLQINKKINYQLSYNNYFITGNETNTNEEINNTIYDINSYSDIIISNSTDNDNPTNKDKIYIIL